MLSRPKLSRRRRKSRGGVVALARAPARKVFGLTVGLGFVSLAGLLMSSSLWMMLGWIFGLGLAVANVFPIIFGAALQRSPAQQNEVSGLLIMGVSGGAILLPVMGFISDARGDSWALSFLLLAWGYLAWLGRMV
jgi:MFS transporter, FHS family, L-fucose permease